MSRTVILHDRRVWPEGVRVEYKQEVTQIPKIVFVCEYDGWNLAYRGEDG
jgi:hypothetical protein